MGSRLTEDKDKWNRRYSEGRRSALHKTLLDFYRLSEGGRALEIACGTGENSLFLAQKGYEVDAIDISDVAIRKARLKAKRSGVRVNFKPLPAQKFSYKPESYNLVVCFYFLERELFPKIERCLKIGGILIFETYNEQHTVVKPKFPREYLLGKGELLYAFKRIRTLYYSERGNITSYVGIKV